MTNMTNMSHASGVGRKALSWLGLSSLVLSSLAVFAAAPVAQASPAAVHVGVVAPFTGSQAFIGGFFGDACSAAAYVIDQAGGVRGHQLSCTHVDNTGDPADAGPNVARALATDSNLDLAVGLDSATAAVTVPLFENANIPLMTLNGLSEYDGNTNPYFWRVEPDDTIEGAALAAYALQRHFTKVATVFANLGSAQSEVTGAITGLKKLHIKNVISLTVPTDAVSYESEVVRVLATHPQAIIVDGDPQTETTFFTQYKQLSTGKMPPPIITSTDLLSTSFTTNMKKNVSASFVRNDIAFIGYYFSNNVTAMKQYRNALDKLLPKKQAATDLTLSGLPTEYDGVIIAALAMTMAKSTTGHVYNADILKVTEPNKKATVVHTYSEGVAALKEQKQIQYVGVDGAFDFNKSHNVSGRFQVFAQTSGSSTVTIATVEPTLVTKATK